MPWQLCAPSMPLCKCRDNSGAMFRLAPQRSLIPSKLTSSLGSFCPYGPALQNILSGTRRLSSTTCQARYQGRSQPSEENQRFSRNRDGDWLEFPSSPSEAEIEIDNLPKNLESSKLDPSVLRRVEAAVESLGGTVTVGDVAAQSGVKLEEAEEALTALVADTQGTLKVSSAGSIVYVIPKGFKASLVARSLSRRLEPALNAAKNTGSYLVRVGFGTALIVSVVLVWLTVIAIMTSSKSDSDNRRSDSGFGRGYPGMYFDMSNLLWYWNPNYYRYQQYRVQRPEGLGLLESIFSVVFGDGDPNASYDRERWEALGRFIQSKKGVVTGEQMAPFLDVAAKDVPDPSSTYVDEGYVTPALVRFGGHPEVDADGNLIYKFPTLQTTAAGKKRMAEVDPIFLERKVQFTAAKSGMVAAVVGIAVLNVVGVAVLGNLLQEPQVQYALAKSSLGFMGNLLPWLQAYAASFFLIPTVRWVLDGFRNKAIEARNNVRRTMLNMQSSARLREKAESAAREAQLDVISDRDIVYRSDRDLADQKRDWEKESFDKRLGKL